MFFRIVDTANTDWVEYECGEGDGIKEFKAFKETMKQNGRKVVRENDFEFDLTKEYRGNFDYLIKWNFHLIQLEVWPYELWFRDDIVGIDAQVAVFNAKSDEDAAEQVKEFCGIRGLNPDYFVPERSMFYLNESGVDFVELI